MRLFALLFLLSTTLVIAGGCRSSSSPTSTVSDSRPADNVVASFGGETLTLAEFQHQYEKSAGSAAGLNTADLESKLEFLDRYVNFRLKVMEARDAGYHEKPEMIAEMASYREQLARPYLLGQEVTDPLVRELYERRTTAVNASHILITVAEDAAPEDTLAAYGRISALRDSVLAGADFGALAYQHSQDPSARREAGQPGARGSLGFFGGGRMVKAFEDQAFSTEIGGVSPVFRTQFGYHILQVKDKRKMPAARELAHIMIQPRGPSAADSAEAASRLEEAVMRLKNGEPFASVAQDVSDDRNSAQNNGNIGVLSFDQGLPPEMRDVAFALAEPGAVSSPVKTPFGMHIVQFVSESPLGTLEEEYETLKAQVGQLPRSAMAQASFARALRQQLGARLDTALVNVWSSSMSPDSLYRTLAQSAFDDDMAGRTIAWLGDSTYSVQHFADFFRTRRMPAQAGDSRTGIMRSLDEFLNARAIDYEVVRLEFTDEDFGRTMQEFRDGLVLFKLMEDSVWTAAASDTSRLKQLYNDHRNEYRFPDRTRVVSWSSSDEATLARVRAALASDVSPNAVLSDSTMSVRLDTTYIESSTDSVYDRVLQLSEGESTEPLQYNNRFLMLQHGGIEKARPKSFDEAQAELVNTYQALLEEQLVNRLRVKYNGRTWPERVVDGSSS